MGNIIRKRRERRQSIVTEKIDSNIVDVTVQKPSEDVEKIELIEQIIELSNEIKQKEKETEQVPKYIPINKRKGRPTK